VSWPRLLLPFALFFVLFSSLLTAYESTGFYLGGFGGLGYSGSNRIFQKGQVHYEGPAVVHAVGRSLATTVGFGGAHFGYIFREPFPIPISCQPELELEGVYFSDEENAVLGNRLHHDLPHLFHIIFPMRVGLITVNAATALGSYALAPYGGIGFGAAIVSIHNADIFQLIPNEPGIDHVNSDDKALDWTYTFLVKAGLRYQCIQFLRFFLEYRFFYIPATRHLFGSTIYPRHVPTTRWEISLHSRPYNAFAFGLDITL